MISSLRFSGSDAVRPFLLAILAALIWLVLGANTAEAAPSEAISVVSGEPTVSSATHGVPLGGLADAAGTPATQAVPLPITPVVAPVTGVVEPVTEVLAPVTDAAVPVTEVLAPVTDFVPPVTKVIGTVLDEVEGTVDTVEAVISPVLELPPLPPVPVPAVQILPELSEQAPEPDGILPVLPVPPGVPSSRDAAGAFSPLAVPGFPSAGISLVGTTPPATALSAKPSPPPPDGGQPLNQVAVQGQAGSVSSGSGRAPQAAADVTVFRAGAQFTKSARIGDSALSMPASPSYDPGSSPD